MYMSNHRSVLINQVSTPAYDLIDSLFKIFEINTVRNDKKQSAIVIHTIVFSNFKIIPTIIAMIASNITKVLVM